MKRITFVKREVDFGIGTLPGAMQSFVPLPCFRIVLLSLRPLVTRSQRSAPSHFARPQLTD